MRIKQLRLKNLYKGYFRNRFAFAVIFAIAAILSQPVYEFFYWHISGRAGQFALNLAIFIACAILAAGGLPTGAWLRAALTLPIPRQEIARMIRAAEVFIWPAAFCALACVIPIARRGSVYGGTFVAMGILTVSGFLLDCSSSRYFTVRQFVWLLTIICVLAVPRWDSGGLSLAYVLPSIASIGFVSLTFRQRFRFHSVDLPDCQENESAAEGGTHSAIQMPTSFFCDEIPPKHAFYRELAKRFVLRASIAFVFSLLLAWVCTAINAAFVGASNVSSLLLLLGWQVYREVSSTEVVRWRVYRVLPLSRGFRLAHFLSVCTAASAGLLAGLAAFDAYSGTIPWPYVFVFTLLGALAGLICHAIDLGLLYLNAGLGIGDWYCESNRTWYMLAVSMLVWFVIAMVYGGGTRMIGGPDEMRVWVCFILVLLLACSSLSKLRTYEML
jgi:hypothetical protein